MAYGHQSFGLLLRNPQVARIIVGYSAMLGQQSFGLLADQSSGRIVLTVAHETSQQSG